MRLISIFKSPRKEEMYLYVDKKQGLTEVPAALLERFGKPVHLMDMPLTEKRTLARANVQDVLDSLRQKGFYLQMPPPTENYMKEIVERVEQAKAERDI